MSDWKEANSRTDETWNGIGSIEGTYVEKKTNVGMNSSNIYVLKSGDKSVGVWGSTVIDGDMAMIPMGSEVRIEALGEQRSKIGTKYKAYKIMFREVPMRDVNDVFPETKE